VTERGASPRSPQSGQPGLAWNSPNLAGPQTHGPHRYVFQLFALAADPGSAAPQSARPREVLAAARDVLARGRLDGFYRRA